jgi:hypothetical protein
MNEDTILVVAVVSTRSTTDQDATQLFRAVPLLLLDLPQVLGRAVAVDLLQVLRGVTVQAC